MVFWSFIIRPSWFMSLEPGPCLKKICGPLKIFMLQLPDQLQTSIQVLTKSRYKFLCGLALGTTKSWILVGPRFVHVSWTRTVLHPRLGCGWLGYLILFERLEFSWVNLELTSGEWILFELNWFILECRELSLVELTCWTNSCPQLS